MENKQTLRNEAEALMRKLTLEEKIGMIHGAELFCTAPVERLGIPALVMSDGPMGVRQEFEPDNWKSVGNHDDYVTYLPCNSALAATWNRELARAAGEVLGAEARGRGKDVILGPGVNIKRSPLCGRNFEYFSEDPFLTKEMAVPYIQGVQNWDVAACVKHFAVNNQETQRLWVDVKIDDKALREIYLPAFYDAVKKGGSYTIMGAYNRLYGEHCCQSDFLLNQVLRKEWDYDGVVISDWGGVHDTAEAAKSQLDIEMSVTSDFDQYFMAEPLRKLIEEREEPTTVQSADGGHTREETAEEERRMPGKTVDEEEHRILAKNAEEDSQTQGKSMDEEERRILAKAVDEKVVRILMLMMRLHMLGGERKSGAYNTPEHRQAALDVARESVVLLKNDAGILPFSPEDTKEVLVIGENADLQHAPGGGSAEIKALYEITPLMGIKMLLGGNAKVTYVKGYCQDPKEEGTETNWQETSLENGGGGVGKTSGGDDLRESGRDAAGEAEQGNSMQDAAAEAEQGNSMQDAAAETAQGNCMQNAAGNDAASLAQYRRQLREEAVRKAKEFDRVIFVGGLNHEYDCEGNDRADMKLPYGQDILIQELLQANPNTVIVMVGGSPVEMGSWVSRADSLVWSWYAGMEGGRALAEVLFGRINPSGKLPESFYKTHTDCSAHAWGQFAETESVDYAEGIFVGYRYLDARGIEPEFCFGHGLSYTSFAYEAAGLIEEDGKVYADCRVTNTGNMAGKETVQVYLAPKNRKEDEAVQQLKGFEKVYLEPGESKTVRIEVEGYSEGMKVRVGSSLKEIRAEMA